MSNPLEWFGDKIQAEVRRRMIQKMETWGPKVVAEAKRLVHVDTGQTKASIGWTMRQSDMTLQIHADTPWAIFLEMGTSRTPAYPFLRPALNIIRGLGTGGITTEIQLTAPSRDSGYRQHLSRELRRTRGGQSKVRTRRYDPGRIGDAA
jgi:HK97 gp10 family phage protein